MSTKLQVDFHDTGPPESLVGSQRPEKLRLLLEQVGNITHYLPSPRLTIIDLETSLSATELQCFIVDNFDFAHGKILIDDDLKIVKDSEIHGSQSWNDR